MWIYIPDVDNEKEAWVGTISPPEGPKSRGSFELIRHVNPTDMYLTSPFERRKSVIGLLDHQRPCTLFRPLVHHIDPGLLGVRIGFQRTQIKGSFEALLIDLSVEDNDEKIFNGIAFESEAFGTWYAPPAYSTDFNTNTRTHVVEIKETERKEFDLPTLGHLTCTSGANVSSGVRSGVIKSVSLFRLDFSAPMSLTHQSVI